MYPIRQLIFSLTGSQ